MTSYSRLAAPGVAIASLLAVAAPAAAAWLVTAPGATASARAGALASVGVVSSSATDKSVTLSWAAPVTGVTPGGYTVRRTSPTQAVVCDTTSAITCTDTGLVPGTAYAYSVAAVRSGWTGPASSASATTALLAAPAGSDIQSTSDADGQVERDEKVAYTYNQPVNAASIVSGWTGSARTVFVQVSDGGAAGNDVLTVYADAAYTTLVNVGSVDLGRVDYVVSTTRFGPASGQTASLVMSGSTVTLNIGARQSGLVSVAGGPGVLVWTPSASATATGGGAVATTPVVESGTLDRDF